LDLQTAQREIASDWIEPYKKYVFRKLECGFVGTSLRAALGFQSRSTGGIAPGCELL
jgi:hypothetical protein